MGRPWKKGVTKDLLEKLKTSIQATNTVIAGINPELSTKVALLRGIQKKLDD